MDIVGGIVKSVSGGYDIDSLQGLALRVARGKHMMVSRGTMKQVEKERNGTFCSVFISCKTAWKKSKIPPASKTASTTVTEKT